MGMCLADEMESTITWPSEVSSSYSSGTIKYTIDKDLILSLGVQYTGIFGSASNIWYPGGCRDGSNKIGGYVGFCWSVTRRDDKFAEAFTISGISVRPTGGWTRSSGGQVRCLKE